MVNVCRRHSAGAYGPDNDELEQTKRVDGRAPRMTCVINVHFAAQLTVGLTGRVGAGLAVPANASR
jgi:hypothetical protein